MPSVKVEVPIYYIQEFKTKAPITYLVGDNVFRNAHYHLKNQMKQHYHQLIVAQLVPPIPLLKCFRLDIAIYYKNSNSDPSNIVHTIEKFSLDALRDSKVIANDSMLYHLGTSYHVAGKDTDNPRCVITISEA